MIPCPSKFSLTSKTTAKTGIECRKFKDQFKDQHKGQHYIMRIKENSLCKICKNIFTVLGDDPFKIYCSEVFSLGKHFDYIGSLVHM